MQQTQAESLPPQLPPDRDHPPTTCQLLIINFNVNAIESQYAEEITEDEMMTELMQLLQSFREHGVQPVSIAYNQGGICITAHFEDEQWENILGPARG